MCHAFRRTSVMSSAGVGALLALVLAGCATVVARLDTDGVARGLPLPNPNSGVTTISVAADGTLWFTESSGNRIGRMNPDGSGYRAFALPHANSSPRIIAVGADGN